MTVERSSLLNDLRPRTGDQIRNAFLAFFNARGHQVLPSASLIPQDPTVLLTIAGMLPFKPIFLGQTVSPSLRVASSQKCIRTNDIENVGRTARHQTFFEMLGNFSFGDYFKKEAIQWAWELSTDVFGLDQDRLVISVFREDDESEQIWRDVVGVDPKRIIRMDEADNFWAAGPTGPCGPCSEIYYDFKPEIGDSLINLEDDSRFLEFYNLVFMQYNRDASGTITPLANCNIDTGMGLERMAQILQQVPNNYETDLIFPLLQKAASLASIDYHQIDEKEKISLKVIGDHSRAITQLISDGVLASNLGRGYILRRLIRRVVRHGRLIGINRPFLMEMGDTAIQLMHSAYPDLLKRRDLILKELVIEEERFLSTLERGEKLLTDLIASKPLNISGEKAFELYDTYGFPLELTEEIAEENHLQVDIDGFKYEMELQRKRAKAASVTIDLTIQDVLDKIVTELPPTNFEGYANLDKTSSVQALIVNGTCQKRAVAGDQVEILLDATPFYGEGGGQVGDKGILLSSNSKQDNLMVQVDTVTRNKDIFVHSGKVLKGYINQGDLVHSRVDQMCRCRAQANHTSTHLLQAALKQVVDPDISQAGSLVDFDRLRFDFYCSKAVNNNQLEKVEALINLWISESHSLHINNLPIDKAKELGAIAMFGEKYGDVVRVVDVPGVSMELCGGTHVANTAEIGIFKIVGESGIAAGIRRIEAISGLSVLKYLNERDEVVRQLCTSFKAKPFEIVDRVSSLQEEMKMASKELSIANEELARAKARNLVNDAIRIGKSIILVKRLDGFSGAALQAAAQDLLNELGTNAAVVLGGVPEPSDQTKVSIVAAFGADLVANGLAAGKFVGYIAKICGGGGGGKPNLAQAGGRDSKNLNKALDLAMDELKRSCS